MQESFCVPKAAAHKKFVNRKLRVDESADAYVADLAVWLATKAMMIERSMYRTKKLLLVMVPVMPDSLVPRVLPVSHATFWPC